MRQLSIKESIETHLSGSVLSSADLHEFMVMFTRVLFCLDNATVLPKFFTTRKYFELARDAKGLKLSLLANGYTLKNCKFFINAVATGKALPSDNTTFGVLDEDVAPLLEGADAGKVLKFCKAKSRLYKYVSMKTFESALSEELSSNILTIFMNKFIHRKLKFVMNSQGVSAYDLRTEFISHSIIRVYRTYPRIENRAHLRNLLRQVIHARGISIIGEAAKAQRSNLLRSANGDFLGRLAPFHLMPKELLDHNRDNLSCSITGGTTGGESDWIFRQDLSKSIDSASVDTTNTKFLTAVFHARRDPDFITYLRCNIPGSLQRKLPEDSELPEFLMTRNPDVLVTHAIRYSGVDPDEAIFLLRTIKDECLST